MSDGSRFLAILMAAMCAGLMLALWPLPAASRGALGACFVAHAFLALWPAEHK